MTNRDPIERLVRLAGIRPSVSSERTARVRTAAHAEWTRVVAAQTRRRRFVTTTAGLALAAMVLLIVQYSTGRGARPPVPRAQVATLTAATGAVVVDGQPVADEPLSLTIGGSVHASRVIHTRRGVFAALRLTTGSMLRMDESTRLRIDSPRVVTLVDGRIYVDIPGRDSSLDVRTALGSVRDIGTRFEVRVGNGQLRVRVRDGEVIVNADGRTASAGLGTEISSGADGLVTRPVAPFGSDWAWISRTAPPFALAGRTLAEFLEWLSGETGYSIEFQGDADVVAATTVLHGSIDGLTPEEALDVVLPSTRLEYRIVNGRLIVRAR
jgi:ferric-dicitrate binding protein FerR (iron transport regulator)